MAADAKLSTVRINSGGPALTDVDGLRWQADAYFDGGRMSATTATTAGTAKGYLFKDDRYAMSAYRIPVVNGRYDVKLLEAEQYFDAAGKRVFSVSAEGVTVARDVDLFKRAGGKNKAFWIEFTTTVTDGRLDLGFTASVNHPKVNGIAVLPSATQPSASSPSPEASPAPTPAPQPAPESSPAATQISPHRDPVLWGLDDDAEFDPAEAELGRQFALARQYRRLDQSFLSSRGQALVNRGHSLVLSVKSRSATAPIPYADIVAGKYDAKFLAGLRQLDALVTPTYFIFQHEADSTAAKAACKNQADSACGPEFVAAWKHIRDLARANGITKVLFTWTVTSYGFNPQTHVRNNYYWPGAAYTDWLGVDAYNGGCNDSWYGSFAEMLEYTLDWARVHAPGRPIILPEWGATEGSTPTAKADFFNGVTSALQQPGYENVKAVVYWSNGESGCDFHYNSSARSRDAFRNLGHASMMSAMPGPVT